MKSTTKMSTDGKTLSEEVWKCESNRLCGDCTKHFENKDEAHVLLDPVVMLVCEDCKCGHVAFKSKLMV